MINRKRMGFNNKGRNMMKFNNMQNKPNNILNDKVKMNTLTPGSTGEDVEHLQEMLLNIVNFFPSLPIVTIDGVFGDMTKNAVMKFQDLNGMTPNGIVDMNTWNKLHYVSNKTRNERQELINGIDYLDQSNNIISEGSQGEYVKNLQSYINKWAGVYSNIPTLKVDGVFGPKTKVAVIEFQRLKKLTPDGIVGDQTWDALINQETTTD